MQGLKVNGKNVKPTW